MHNNDEVICPCRKKSGLALNLGATVPIEDLKLLLGNGVSTDITAAFGV